LRVIEDENNLDPLNYFSGRVVNVKPGLDLPNLDSFRIKGELPRQPNPINIIDLAADFHPIPVESDTPSSRNEIDEVGSRCSQSKEKLNKVL
jgi:hypothetical protein